MQFVTLREQKLGWHRFRAQWRRRSYFFEFEYDISPDPTEERIAVKPGPELWKWGVRDDWPDVVDSVGRCWRTLRDGGCHHCSVHLVITAATTHVDTDAEAIRRNVMMFLGDRVRAWTKPIEPFPHDWLTSTVVSLAWGIHADAAFDRLPILCDALQDAGCTDQFVIDHLQMCPDHGTSCWVVEMILDRLPEP